MPRDNDKNNDSRGRRDRPGGGKGRSGGGKGRSGAARGPEKKFAKRGFAGKSEGDGERRPYAGKSDGAKSYGKKPYAGGGKPYAGKRDGDDRPPRRDFGDSPRPRFNRDDVPPATVRIAARARISVRARTVTARSARTSRVAIARISVAMIVAARSVRTTARRPSELQSRRSRRAAIATMPVRPGVSRTRNSATSGPIRRAKVAARSGPTRRAAKVFAKTATGPRGDRPFSARPSRDGDRPRRSPERKFGGDKKFLTRRAGPRPAQGFRQSPGSRPDAKTVAEARCVARFKPWRNSRRPCGALRQAPLRQAARDRGGDERPRFSRPREDRAVRRRPSAKFDRPREGPRATVRNSTVRVEATAKAAPTGRSIRAANAA